MNLTIPNPPSNSRWTTKPDNRSTKEPKVLSEKSPSIAEPIWEATIKIKLRPWPQKILITTECIWTSPAFSPSVSWSIKMGFRWIIIASPLQTLRWSSQYHSKLRRSNKKEGHSKRLQVLRLIMILLKMTFHIPNQDTDKTQNTWNSSPKSVICKKWTTKSAAFYPTYMKTRQRPRKKRKTKTIHLTSIATAKYHKTLNRIKED